MKVAIVGGGPAGLCLGLFLKGRDESVDVEVFDQNPRDATYGFGVVLSERFLPNLGAAGGDLLEEVQRASYVTRHHIIKHGETSIFVEGSTYGSAIKRLDLLTILRRHCERRGVVLHHDRRVEDPTALVADVVVGADGVHSVVRRALGEALGATSRTLTNRLAWYGTRRHFPYPMLAFKSRSDGHFVAAAYPYSDSLSTFVAECDDATWTRSGLRDMSDEERRVFTERVFAEELRGEELLSNRSTWGSLVATRTRDWSVGRYVLIGDALHSAHPTIGSGTRLAMDDAVALGHALLEHRNNLPLALATFRERREPGKAKLVAACDRSIAWYERFGEKLASLDPVQFVFDFMTRTGRIDERRLFDEFPRFMERHAEDWRAFAQGRRDLGATP